jgi:DTW domain-containing protein YfiP
VNSNCERCEKAPALCMCDAISSVQHRISVLILQHPQEPDKVLGSARLAQLSLANAQLRVGLSWPNLRTALGREASPSRWAVLYLGSAQAPGVHSPLVFVDRDGRALGDQDGCRSSIEGLIVLDGTWSQAKTLWWRNAWLLKCRRAILRPPEPSLYGRMRREPRRECLSTIESVGLALTGLGESAEVEASLKGVFRVLLDRARRPRGTRE